MRIATRAIHAGQHPEAITGAIMTPVFQTSTYVQHGPGEHTGYEYSRTQNPTREALERNIADLESASHAFAFASGCAAAATVMHLFKAGDHIVCNDDVYGGTHRLFTQVMATHGLEFTFVDLGDVNALEGALRPNTKALWLETPSNPLLKIIDLKALSTKAHAHELVVICDNTFATPILQRPLELGCDIVVHSTTKYMGGHSDVIGGAACTNNDTHAKRLGFLRNSLGNVPGPWDAWLVLRGMKTLPLRMKAHCENASRIAAYLVEHKRIERVMYPGLKTHPGHAIAASQMSAFGGMITFILEGGLPQAERFLKSVKIFALAESLGGVESLIEHPALMTHASIPAHIRAQLGINDGLIRISVGIEDVNDLLEDLDQALSI